MYESSLLYPTIKSDISSSVIEFHCSCLPCSNIQYNPIACQSGLYFSLHYHICHFYHRINHTSRICSTILEFDHRKFHCQMNLQVPIYSTIFAYYHHHFYHIPQIISHSLFQIFIHHMIHKSHFLLIGH